MDDGIRVLVLFAMGVATVLIGVYMACQILSA
jgi:hypothetical protein